MANVWQGNYWTGGTKQYTASNSYSKAYYDSATGYCNIGNIGDMRAGRYGSADNVVCLRFACNDANYSAININCYNANNYTGQGTVKILVRTSEISSVTKTALENLGTTTMTYTCAYGSSTACEENNVKITYNFTKGTVYYIYIWGKDSDTWRFRWYEPTANNFGFSVSYTVASYKLTISQGTGTTITVKRGSTTLSNGATISSGDSLTISISANTGYTLSSRSHNNGTYTVSGNITVSATATINQYTITISQGTGTTVIVKNGSTTLSNGAKVNHGTQLTVTISANTGYNLASQSHSNGTYTITGNTTFSATASLKTYKLTISQGTGTTISVNRTSSPKQGASTGTLSNNATIYYSDVLQITFSTSDGHELGSHTVNGSNFTSGGSHTVTGNVTVISSANLSTYKLYITTGVGCNAYVTGDGDFDIFHGSSIAKGSTLTINFMATDDEYVLAETTVNGAHFTSGQKHTVQSDVYVSCSTRPRGVSIGNDESFDKYTIHIGNGRKYESYVLYIGNGETWELYGE